MPELQQDIDAIMIDATSGKDFGCLTLQAGTRYERQGSASTAHPELIYILVPIGVYLARYRIHTCLWMDDEQGLCQRPANGRFCERHGGHVPGNG